MRKGMFESQGCPDVTGKSTKADVAAILEQGGPDSMMPKGGKQAAHDNTNAKEGSGAKNCGSNP